MGAYNRVGILSEYAIFRAGLSEVLDQSVVYELGVRAWPPDLDVIVFDIHALGVHRGQLVAASKTATLVLLTDPRVDLPSSAAAAFATGGVLSVAVSASTIRDTIDRASSMVPDAVDEIDYFDASFSLSPQECAALRGVASGASNSEIAADMLVSVNTLKTYIRQAYRKIGVSRRSQAVAWVFEQQRAAASVPDLFDIGQPANGLDDPALPLTEVPLLGPGATSVS